MDKKHFPPPFDFVRYAQDDRKRRAQDKRNCLILSFPVRAERSQGAKSKHERHDPYLDQESYRDIQPRQVAFSVISDVLIRMFLCISTMSNIEFRFSHGSVGSLVFSCRLIEPVAKSLGVTKIVYVPVMGGCSDSGCDCYPSR